MEEEESGFDNKLQFHDHFEKLLNIYNYDLLTIVHNL